MLKPNEQMLGSPLSPLILCRIPLTATNKIQRVGMAQRLGLPEMTDRMPAQACLFEATCPPGPSQPQQKIPCSLVPIKTGQLQPCACLHSLVPFPCRQHTLMTHLASRMLVHDGLTDIVQQPSSIHFQLLRTKICVAACSDAAAALKRHLLVSEAAVTTLHSRVLGFVTLKSPQPPTAEQGSRSAALQVTGRCIWCCLCCTMTTDMCW